MSQTLVKNYLHIIFSTKKRKPLIHPPVEAELHKYLGGICNNLECFTQKIGGYFDHVHIVCLLSKKISLTTLLGELKSSSSSWIKSKGCDYENFYWQTGYGAFSISPAELDRVITYVERQHEHHKNMSFQDEYRELLKHHKVEYDERYVWD